MSTRHRSPAPGLTSFAIYEDPEDKDLLSPSDMSFGDLSHSFHHVLPTSDEAIPSMELDDDALDGPEPYQTTYTSRKSSSHPRRSSGYSLVSSIPSEASVVKHSIPSSDASDARHTPRKERPRFRNPESVRAMQMSSPPLLPTIETSRERLKGSYKLMTPSRSGRSETPLSKKSSSRSMRELHSPRPTPTPQQAPLVLLHVTILPPQVPYSHDLMVKIMPGWLVENYRLLEEKLQDIILMRRGLLIPHPRDEFDLLEERILESLELKTPRLLKCGHFVAPEDEADREDEADEASGLDDNTGRGSRMSGGTFTEELELQDGLDAADTSMCSDCHHEMKRPGKGIGAGKRRWQVKIYAANGLMPANAWTACWNDMERCDVEIAPWIPDELRKTFEQRILEEQEAEKRKHMYAVELQRQIQEATTKQKLIEQEEAERKRAEEMELQKTFEAAATALQRSVEEKAAERKKFEDAVEEKIAQAKVSIRAELEAQALGTEAATIPERLRALEASLERQVNTPALAETLPATPAELSRPVRAADIPLSTLLKNYFLILLKDQRNIIILVLGALAISLAMNMNPTLVPQAPTIEADMRAVHTVAVTTTATTTATSFSTLTVTETQSVVSMQETGLPIHSVLDTEAFNGVAVEPSPLVNSEAAEVTGIDDEESLPATSSPSEGSSPATSSASEDVFSSTLPVSEEKSPVPSSAPGLHDPSDAYIGFSELNHLFPISLPYCNAHAARS